MREAPEQVAWGDQAGLWAVCVVEKPRFSPAKAMFFS